MDRKIAALLALENQFGAGDEHDGGGDDDHLGLTVRHRLRDRFGRHGPQLGLHLLRDAETLENALEVIATRACRRMSNRFCVEQGLFEGLDRADVGLRRSGAHADTNRRERDIGAGRLPWRCSGVQVCFGLIDSR